jgi:hypothetical protein
MKDNQLVDVTLQKIWDQIKNNSNNFNVLNKNYLTRTFNALKTDE